MPDLTRVIPTIRESVAAILRIQPVRPETVKKGKVRPASFKVSLAGSAFCIVADQYFLTAHHILNGEQQRNPNDKFYAFVVPGNGNIAHHFPVTSFPIERADIDIAVLKVGPCATVGISVPAIPVSFKDQVDGSRVVTVGFPSPEIAALNLDAQGNYLEAKFS